MQLIPKSEGVLLRLWFTQAARRSVREVALLRLPGYTFKFWHAPSHCFVKLEASFACSSGSRAWTFPMYNLTWRWALEREVRAFCDHRQMRHTSLSKLYRASGVATLECRLHDFRTPYCGTRSLQTFIFQRVLDPPAVQEEILTSLSTHLGVYRL